MIALDTNILVRYLVQDDPVQGKAASRLIQQHCTSEIPGFIALITLCELTWVLRSAYRFSKEMTIKALEGVLSTAELEVERSDYARSALHEYQNGPADFADYLLGVIAHHAGVRQVMTFDKNASKSEYFSLVRTV